MKDKRENSSDWDWKSSRRKGLSALQKLLDLDLPRLWPMSCPDESFVKYVGANGGIVNTLLVC